MDEILNSNNESSSSAWQKLAEEARDSNTTASPEENEQKAPLEFNPTTIQELLIAYRDEAGEVNTYEQNRNDAYELEYTGTIGSRRFIHNQSPGAHEILAAMLDFYDTKDDAEGHASADAKLCKVLDKYSSNFYELGNGMFDLDNYEKEDERRTGNGSRTGEKEKVIDALRRLVENTKPKLEEKPDVKDEHLGELIKNMHLGLNEKSGEVYVNFREVGKIVSRTNELLKERQGTTGISASEIKVIAFVEKMATYAMKGIDKADRQELPFDPHFKEICRFAELTSQSGKYDESGFERFWNIFSRIRNYEDDNELNEHYQALAKRRLMQLRGLPDKSPYLKQHSSELWSGNLNDELLGLIGQRS